MSNGLNFGAASTTGAFDVDGDGRVDPLSDGLLMVRYLFGIRGPALIQGVVASGATRKIQTEIETWLSMFAP